MVRSKEWYINALKIDVRRDVNNNQEIKCLSEPYFDYFVRFAAVQRVTYKNNIQEEWKEFSNQYLNNRLYDTNVKLWKRISKKVFQRDKYTCQYCGQVGGKLEVDHRIPISRGGTNELDNLATACQHCNRQKHDKTPSEFERWKCHE